MEVGGEAIAGGINHERESEKNLTDQKSACKTLRGETVWEAEHGRESERVWKKRECVWESKWERSCLSRCYLLGRFLNLMKMYWSNFQSHWLLKTPQTFTFSHLLEVDRRQLFSQEPTYPGFTETKVWQNYSIKPNQHQAIITINTKLFLNSPKHLECALSQVIFKQSEKGNCFGQGPPKHAVNHKAMRCVGTNELKLRGSEEMIHLWHLWELLIHPHNLKSAEWGWNRPKYVK